MRYVKTVCVLACGCLLLAASCSLTHPIISDFQAYNQQLSADFVPDPSVSLYEAHLVSYDGQWRLQGQTTLPTAYRRIVSFTDQLLGTGNYHNQMLLLPDSRLMPDQYGLIRVSTAQLRAGPKHSTEMVDQAIMGRIIRLLKQEGEWFLVQTDYDYIGWMTQGSFFRTDCTGVNAWSATPRVRVRSNYAVIRSEPNPEATPATDVTLNACLKPGKTQGDWTRVILPDGRRGWIKNDDILPWGVLQYPNLSQRDSIIKTATQMTGIPYLWGGNSSIANDCSGFVQTVFKANGIQLPRDARQQAHRGRPVEITPDYAELLPGDLLFFGQFRAITHVAISLGGPRFIHQSQDVHVNSLDPDDPDFRASSQATLKIVKRILPESAEQ